MENRSHALVAGIFTVLLSIAIIAAAMWLNRDTQERVPYVLTTSGTVAGLNPQAAVRYRGMEVGKVEAIEFDREMPGRIEIIECADHDTIGDLRRRAPRVRIEHDDPVPHLPCRDGHHPTELPTAEHADRRARHQRRHGSVSSSTRCV